MGRFNSLVWMSLRNASDIIAADTVNFNGVDYIWVRVREWFV